MSLLDAGTAAWFVAAITLLLLQQFGKGSGDIASDKSDAAASRRGALGGARGVLVPVVVLLGCVFAWKIFTVFAPMLGFELS